MQIGCLEIKLLASAILSSMKVKLVGDRYEIYDKLVIASTPPGASFMIKARETMAE